MISIATVGKGIKFAFTGRTYYEGLTIEFIRGKGVTDSALLDLAYLTRTKSYVRMEVYRVVRSALKPNTKRTVDEHALLRVIYYLWIYGGAPFRSLFEDGIEKITEIYERNKHLSCTIHFGHLLRELNDCSLNVKLIKGVAL